MNGQLPTYGTARAWGADIQPTAPDEGDPMPEATEPHTALDPVQAARLDIVRELLGFGIRDVRQLLVLGDYILTGAQDWEPEETEVPQMQPVARTSPTNTEPIYSDAQRAAQQ